MYTTVIAGNRDMILEILKRETGAVETYSGAPLFTCTVGGFSLLRDGRLICEGDETEMFAKLAGLGLCDYACDPPASDPGGIRYDLSEHTGTTLLNLFCMLSARQRLINRALHARGAFFISPELMRELLAHPPVTVTDFLRALSGKDDLYKGVGFLPDEIVLYGFCKGLPEEETIHRQLVDRMVKTAMIKTRVRAFMPNVRNRKYVFRTWLNSIGMKGPEYSEARRILLARLPGRSDRRRIPVNVMKKQKS